jgi:hypothetical protein
LFNYVQVVYQCQAAKVRLTAQLPVSHRRSYNGRRGAWPCSPG